MPLAACLALGLVASAPPLAVYPPRGEQIIPADCRFVAKLKTKISSDKAKLGDLVELESTEDVRASDGTVYIPKKARFLGKVQRAQVFDRDREQAAQLAFSIERAEWDGGYAKLRGVVVSLRGHPRFEVAPQDSPPPCYNEDIKTTHGIIHHRCDSASHEPVESGSTSTKGYVVPQDWDLVKMDDLAIFSVIMSEQRNISLPSGFLFVLRHRSVD